MLKNLNIAGVVLVFGVAAWGAAIAADTPPSAAAASPAAPASAGGSGAKKIEFAKVRSKILPGDKIGSMEGGWFCVGHRDMKASDRIEAVLDQEAGLAFKQVVRTQGLLLASQEVSAFDTAQPSDTDYRLGGVVTALDNNMCSKPGGVKGSMHVEVKWDLFSTQQQRVVASRSTTGNFSLDSFSEISPRDFEVKAFEAAMTQFVADPEVKSLLSGGASTLPAATAQAPLHLKAGSVVIGATALSAEALKAAVVTISGDRGMGSGFYIADGYVLTDRHVVGSSKYVKVKLASGKEVVGEVLREDGPRDVALLKTESAGVPVIHLRVAEPTVGEDVYAIGSPLTQQLAGTFTHGVLSGVRETEGVRFLQSDVAVNPGNSGGPLLDATGSAIGMAALKMNGTSGLAFFVPMRDALDRLSVVFDAPDAH